MRPQVAGHARRSGRLARAAHRAVVGVLALGGSGCYRTGAIVTPTPSGREQVELELTDAGRAALGPQMGPGLQMVRGTLSAVTDSTYSLRVLQTRDIRGIQTPWSGEELVIRRTYVAAAQRRSLDTGKSLLVGGLAAAALGVVIVGASRLTGSGGGDQLDGRDPQRPVDPVQ